MKNQTAGTDALVSADAVSERLGMSNEWVYSAARRGVIPSVRIGGALRFDMAAIDLYIEENTREALA